jgi:hypothetical protein
MTGTSCKVKIIFLINCLTLLLTFTNSHQSLVKLAEHNRNQMVWVPGHMGIDGNI